MPTLDWIGKKAVLNHHKQVPYRLLHCDTKLSAGESPSLTGRGQGEGWKNTTDNLLVQGDNLEALKALLPYYAGKVKCIYIDPPYNTGNEKWVYNDAVNSPEMRNWLGKVVGAEAEDLSRHDKWLCMMYPRLTLLREFLTEDGAIFVSIDDAEIHHLLMLLNEIFGVHNHIGTVIWQHSVQPKGYTDTTSVHHNFIAAFRKSEAFKLAGVPREERHNVNYANPDSDPNGPWRSGDVRNALYRPNLIYDLVTPSGKKIKAPAKGWRWSKETMAEKIANGEIVFRDDETRILRKIYLKGQDRRPVESIWFGEDVGTTRVANQDLKSIFEGPPPFDTPKPVRLVERVIQVATADKDSLIMDSFAGSGTTGHAVLRMNKADGGNRRCILVEIDPNIAATITAQRLMRVIEGYHPGGDKSKDKVEGTGGGFRYCKLGEPLFDEAGNIRPSVRFPELAAHVFFTETGAPIPKKPRRANGVDPHPDSPWKGEGYSPLLGVHSGKAVYLLFNGVMGDKRPDGGNVLTSRILVELPSPGPSLGGRGVESGRPLVRIIYGEGCRLGPARLKRERIVFRQIPYEIKVT